MANNVAAPLLLYLDGPSSDPAVIACLSETHTKTNTLTDNPVEKGSNITDHSRPEPDRLQLECIASNTPPPNGGYTDAGQLWTRLDQLHNTPRLIDAVTLGGVYESMGIESVSRPIDVKTANAVKFTLALKKVRVVQNRYTRIVTAKSTKAQPKQKLGAATTTQADKPVERAALRRIVLAGGGS